VGCGVRLFWGSGGKSGDVLERRAREWLEEPISVDAKELLAAIWKQGPVALAEAAGVPESLAELVHFLKLEKEEGGALPVDINPELVMEQLGSIGGGNHFAEIGEIDSVFDKERAEKIGLKRGMMVAMAHSGSRGLGGWLAGRWERDPEVPVTGEEARIWEEEARGAVRFAQANRLVLVWRLLGALGLLRAEKLGGTLDVVHNYVEESSLNGERVFLHRKGAAPAARDQLTVVLGSRGAHTEILVGAGQEQCLCSVAHGAGRKMTRTEALAKLKSRYTRASLERTALGSRVICDESSLLFEEHPDAYKPIKPVIDALITAGAATRLASIRPVLTIKQ
jgi:release factor H-coupled RctB family protein